jgi:hypothetical protein
MKRRPKRNPKLPAWQIIRDLDDLLTDGDSLERLQDDYGEDGPGSAVDLIRQARAYVAKHRT